MLSRILVLIVSLASFAAAQNPDRAPLADEWGYRPAENGTVTVNPPAFSWVLEKDANSYAVEWASDSDFKKPVSIGELPWTVYTHNAPFTPGKCFWHYRLALWLAELHVLFLPILHAHEQDLIRLQM